MARITYSFGWKRQQPDRRDFTFQVPHGAVAALPPKFDLDTPAKPAPFNPCWDQGQLGSCFPPGTLVRMADGTEKRIEDVRVLDKVVTAEGNVGVVVKTMARTFSGKLVNLQVWGHNHLAMTPEHPVLTKRGYVKASEIESGDWVAMPRYLPETCKVIQTMQFLPVKERLRKKHVVSYAGVSGRGGMSVTVNPVPDMIELTPGAGRIFGLFLAEGSSSASKVIWTFAKGEATTLAAELIGLLKTELDAEAVLQDRGPTKTSINVVLYGTAWAKLFTGLFGTGAGRKRIHPEIGAGPRDFMESLFGGWMDGDGDKVPCNGRRGGVSVSHELALSMFDIAQGIGLRPCIKRSNPKPSHGVKSRQQRWDIDFMTEGKGDSYRCEQTETHVWRHVRGGRYKDVEYTGHVFNLEVEGDNSYVAEGVGVHNCGPHTLGENIVLDAMLSGGASALAYAVSGSGSVKMPSRLFMYYTTRVLMGTVGQDSGVDNRTMLKALAKYGFCDEELWPYNVAAFRVQPPKQAYDQAASRTGLITYQAVAQDLDTMRAFLATTGRPFVFGFSVYNSMLTPAVDKSGDVPMPGANDPLAGGHDVLIVGYDDARQRFRFKNHWSPDWGNKGYGTIPYAYATNPNLASDFWGVTGAGETPAPPPAPDENLRQQVADEFADLLTKYRKKPSSVTALKEARDAILPMLPQGERWA